MNNKYMLDKNGCLVTTGARVRFHSSTDSKPQLGWVRSVRNDGMFARVDNGQEHDKSGETFSLAAYVRSDEIEVVS